jgi:ERCC4-related helicase
MRKKMPYNPDQAEMFGKRIRQTRQRNIVPMDFKDELGKVFQDLGFKLEIELCAQHGTEAILKHPLLKVDEKNPHNFLGYRDYLMKAAALSFSGNTLVILPTGLGKTYVAMIRIIGFCHLQSPGKILFLAPKRLLVNQHYNLADQLLQPEITRAVIHGKISAKKRQRLWQDNQLIFATPDTIRSEVHKRTINADDVGLLIVDEAQKATGEYHYVPMIKYYQSVGKPILALTAVPFDHDFEAVENFRKMFGVEIDHVLARSYNSSDIKPWLYSRLLSKISVSRGQDWFFSQMRDELLAMLEENCRFFAKSKYWTKLRAKFEEIFIFKNNKLTQVVHGKLIDLQSTLDDIIAKNNYDSEAYSLKYYWSLAEKSANALGQLLYAGIFELQCYLSRQLLESQSADGANASTLRFAENQHVIRVLELIDLHQGNQSQAKHLTVNNIILADPKVKNILELVGQNRDKKIIIFTHLRDSLRKIQLALAATPSLKDLPIFILTGQGNNSNDKGMSDKEQKKVCQSLLKVKQGIVIATSVAEEGLNLSLDLAIFHEPTDNVRSHVNRIGRVARDRDGQVFILCYPEEEKLFFILLNREKNMAKIASYYQSLQTISVR